MSFKKNLRAHFSLEFIKIGFINALLMSAFIFFALFEADFGRFYDFVASFACALFIIGFVCMITRNPNASTWFWGGFFIGIFWFYWIAYSLIYFELAWLIPFEIIAIACLYGIIFAFCFLIFKIFYIISIKILKLKFQKLLKIIFLSVALFCAQFIHPFGFNWLNFSLPFLNTPLQSILIGKPSTKITPFKVYLNPPQFSQKEKWSKSARASIIKANLNAIDQAISQNARLVILPETTFAFSLSSNSTLHKILLEKSQKIAILAGAIGFDENLNYNSAFFYDKGAFKRIDKYILVPFGEQIPLPNFMRDFINAKFFAGASDFASAKMPENIQIDGVSMRVAICYEGTRPEFYESKPEILALISNNAWFKPSTQAVLQKLLLRYYARKNSTLIYHSANGSQSQILR